MPLSCPQQNGAAINDHLQRILFRQTIAVLSG